MSKILIIDDEKDIVNMLSEFLLQRGYTVATALDGEEGLKKFDIENPDLVLCDIKMPRKDGFQFLKEVRASRKWVPLVIISALDDPASVLKGYDFQADFYISKPIDLKEILRSVELMLSLAPLRKDE